MKLKVHLHKNLGHKMYDSGNIGIYKIIHKVYSAGSPLHDNSTKIGPYKYIYVTQSITGLTTVGTGAIYES